MPFRVAKRPSSAKRAGKVSSVDKALDILLLLGDGSGQLGVRQIARRLAMSPSTVHRLLASFVSRGLIQQVDGEYKLGWACVDLGRRVLGSTGLPQAGRPIADALRDKTGETVTIQARVGAEQVCVVEAEGLHELRWRVGVGRRMRLHAGASGRAILAYLPQEELDRYVAAGLPRMGPNTVTDATTLRKLIAETRQRGYATSRGEARAGVAGIACPVFGEQAELLGSMSISGPEERMTPSVVSEFAPLVMAAAARLSRDLGSRAGDTPSQGRVAVRTEKSVGVLA